LKIVSLEAYPKELREGTRKFKIRNWTCTSKIRLKLRKIIEIFE